ncbi:retrovirus-related pol polyprotein from transposon TNT 1-94 [Tanacetum coccineum]|uniref:Retrovirus-related pol polyprotein from transposon TNT 1-94 n=1 Tax=Tanacetum coccineum TaxID=301880 RepID=A0ABQ4XVN0_9ASTR
MILITSHGALDLGFKVLWSKNEGTDEVLEGTAQEYESTAGANLSTARRYCSKVLLLFESTAHYAQSTAVCESTASVIRYLRTYCLLYQISETIRVEESLNVRFDESPPPKSSPLVDDDIIVNQIIENQLKTLKNENEPLNKEIINIKETKDHPIDSVIDENSVVSRNKARLVAQGYNQQKGIYFDETYAPVARLESIRILFAYACAHDFKLFQMDVKSTFLNGFINEEVYVAQPPGFVDFEKPNHVFKLKKTVYGLKQAPKAWYDRHKAFLLDHMYTMGLVDNTLFTKKRDSHIIIVQIYVDDIIFGSTCQDFYGDFSKIMHDEFEMSMMGELNFFLGLQIKQLDDVIFFNQSKYIKEMLKKFGLEDSKPIKTPMSSETKLTRDEDGESVYDIKYCGTIDSLLYLCLVFVYVLVF